MGPADKPSARRQTACSSLSAGVTMVLVLLLFTATVVQTGPVIRSRRMIREIYVENSAATVPEITPEASSGSGTNATTTTTTTTSSDMCLYDGSYVERSAIACEKKHGCRAIQKTGECCPDYQCECQRDGKTYANGEKVFDPNTPCRSCYCQGGEVTCSEVSCYKRNDCDPKYIPGRCCPEYDNCPPLENFKITESSTSTNTKDASAGSSSSSSGERQPEEETNEVKGSYAEAEDLAALQKQHASSTVATAAASPAPAIVANGNPLGIKIKEITKPEEIRLTDNRPSAEEQQQKQQQQQQQLALATLEPSTSQSEELVNLEHLDVNVPDDDENGTKIVRHTEGDGVRSEEDDSKDSSSSASVESLKVASVENRLESSESSTVAASSTLSESDEWLDVKEIVDSGSSSSGWSSSPAPTYNPPVTTAAPAHSTSGAPPQEEESVSEQNNMKLSKQENALPAVVQIGDKLVIVDHNQPKPITVIQVDDVEGLQRGEDDTVYDQEAYTERSHQPVGESGRESSKKLKLHHSVEQLDSQETLSTQADSSASYETVYHPGASGELGSGAASSEEIFETQLYTEGPEDATAMVSSERNDTQASREEFLHTDRVPEPASKLQQQDEDHTMGASGGGAYSSTEEGSTTISDVVSPSFGASSSEASGDEMIYETHFYTEGPNTSSEETKDTTPGAEESSTVRGSTFVPRSPPAIADELAPLHRETYIEDNEPELIHPGFQPIPEDFSLPQLDQPSMDMGDMVEHPAASKSQEEAPTKQEKILSDVLSLKANGSASTEHADSGSGAESSSTEGAPHSEEETSNSPAWLKEDPQPQLRAPGEPLLVPEWERKNDTDGSSSSEEEQSEGVTAPTGADGSPADYHVLKMNSEEYVEGGEGSGSGASTTVAPSTKAEGRPGETENDDDDDDDADDDDDKNKASETAESVASEGSSGSSATAAAAASSILDIDSPASADGTEGQESDSVKHNPKNDVESLKYDEDENNATADEAIPKKVQQLEPSDRESSAGVGALASV